MPFHGRFEGSQSVTPIQPPLALVDGTAAGTGTHLGQFTLTFPHTVNRAAGTTTGTFEGSIALAQAAQP